MKIPFIGEVGKSKAASSQLRRIYEAQPDGMVKQADCVHCSTSNNLIAAPAVDDRLLPAAAAIRAGGIIVSPSQLQDAMNTTPNRAEATRMTAAKPTAAYETHGASTAKGTLTTVDLKSSKDTSAGFDTSQVSVVLRNTNAAGGAALTGVIGDANGILRSDSDVGGLGVGAIAAALEVSGTWGEDTLTRLEQITGNSSIDIQGLHIIATKLDGSEDVSFFAQGSIRTAKASYVGNAPRVERVKTQHQVGQAAFNKNIRVLNQFEMLLTDMDGIPVKVPAGVEVTLTFGIAAVGSGSVMEKPF